MLTHNLFWLDSNFTPPHCGYNFPDHSILYLWNFSKRLQSLSHFSLTWCTWWAWLSSVLVTSPSTGGQFSASRTSALWSGAAGAPGTQRSVSSSWSLIRIIQDVPGQLRHGQLQCCGAGHDPGLCPGAGISSLPSTGEKKNILLSSAKYKSEQLSGGDRLRIKGITILPIMISSYFIWFWFPSFPKI